MDARQVEQLNKNQLIAELRTRGLSAKGNKGELCNRLKAAILEFELSRRTNIEGGGDSSGSDDDGEENAENALDRIGKIEREIHERLRALDALRLNVSQSSSTAAPVNTNTPKSTTASASRFTFRDVEESLNTFNGTDELKIKKWVREFEQSARLCNWDEIQKLFFARRLLSGRAKLFLRSIEPATWKDLKDALVDEFDKDVSDFDVHTVLRETKKTKKESCHEYLLKLMAIARPNLVDDESIMRYVIAGIDDDQANKGILYGAATIREFKAKIDAYEKFKQGFATRRVAAKNSIIDSKPSTSEQSTNGQSAVGERKCYLCGTDGHIARRCPTKDEKIKCFNCEEVGHRATQCPSKTSGEMSSSKPTVKKVLYTCATQPDMMYKTINVDGMIVSALVDTGCDVNLIRVDAVQCMRKTFKSDTSFKLKGAGGKTIETLGQFTAKVIIDEAEFVTRFYVAKTNDIPMLSIIGKELISRAEVIIKNNHIVIKRNDETEENLLMNIRIDSDEFDGVPAKVRELIEGYNPVRTVESTIELKLQMSDEEPVCHRPRRLPVNEKEIVDAQVKEWLRDGVIKSCPSEYSSPVVVVRKKDGTPRVCIDYRDINKKIIKDRYPMPLIEDQLDALQGAKVFTTLDLKNGFFHVPVNEESQKYLSFVTHGGQYTFRKTPFGCCNSPRVFQRYINEVFRELIVLKVVIIYMDDVIIPAKDEEEAIARLKLVLEYAARAGLIIKWSKCQFLMRSVEFLGHVIGDGRIKPSPSKTLAVQRFPEPRTVKQIQSFLGLTGYFRKFIENYATIAKPLSDVLRNEKVFVFKEEQRAAFGALKQRLMVNPVLKIYDPEAETELHTDASKHGFGAVLLQRDNDDQQLHPVHYMSLKTSPEEEKYDSYMLEVLAIVKALKKFRVYLIGIKFKIVTDCDAFIKTLEKKEIIPKVARMVLELQDFNFTREHRKGTRMKHVDSLSRNAIMIISAEENLATRIKSLQQQDDDLQHVFKILETQPYQNYLIRNGVLYKFDNGYELLVVPKALEVDVMKSVHENGHFGVKKMEESVKQRYYIPALREKLRKCVSSCVPCILAENKHGRGEGYLHPIDKEELPLQTYHIDHLGPMEATCKAYKYIFVVTDAFTKFTWLYPTKTTNAKEVLDKLDFQKTTFGNPRRIVSDRGAAFTSNAFGEYCEEEGIEHVTITTGMPRGNGQVERINRCIIPIVTKLAMEDPSKWYRFVPSVQQALNSTYQRSIATTPFKLLLGTTMRRKEDKQIAELLEENFARQFADRRDDERSLAKQHIVKVQEENRRGFNKKRRAPRKYAVGDLVAIKRTQFVNGSKLAGNFLGPYRVTKVKPNERYDVEKAGHHEGPRNTATAAEYMKLWVSSEADEL